MSYRHLNSKKAENIQISTNIIILSDRISPTMLPSPYGSGYYGDKNAPIHQTLGDVNCMHIALFILSVSLQK